MLSELLHRLGLTLLARDLAGLNLIHVAHRGFLTKSGVLGAPQDASASVAMAARTANRRLLMSYLRFDDGSSG
jgi:hypothetical protein